MPSFAWKLTDKEIADVAIAHPGPRMSWSKSGPALPSHSMVELIGKEGSSLRSPSDKQLLVFARSDVRVDNAVDRENPVRYFVMGSNEWRDAQVWPPAATATAFYLNPEPGKKSGLLTTSKPETKERFTRFVADPNNPVVNEYSAPGAHDYRKLVERSDVLTFDTPCLERDMEVTGPIHARIFISCDCRDLDLWVRVLDTAPDGTAFNLMSPGLDVQRASYRDPSRGPQWLTPRNIYQIDRNNLITGNTFLAGHRIRVQISASFFPNFSRNLQNGKSEVTSADAQKATIAVYSDSKHASQVILPVVGRKP